MAPASCLHVRLSFVFFKDVCFFLKCQTVLCGFSYYGWLSVWQLAKVNIAFCASYCICQLSWTMAAQMLNAVLSPSYAASKCQLCICVCMKNGMFPACTAPACISAKPAHGVGRFKRLGICCLCVAALVASSAQRLRQLPIGLVTAAVIPHVGVYTGCRCTDTSFQ